MCNDIAISLSFILQQNNSFATRLQFTAISTSKDQNARFYGTTVQHKKP
jgi:hypothetical protein